MRVLLEVEVKNVVLFEKKKVILLGRMKVVIELLVWWLMKGKLLIK